jgi:hypothetical protein
MRSYIDLAATLSKQIAENLFEAEIPDSEYGYWISPEGQVIAVDYQRHNKVIDAITNGEYDKYRALKTGWLRIYCPRKLLNVSLYVESLTPRAISALRQLAFSGRFSEYEAEINGPNNKYSFKDFSAPEPFIGAVKLARNEARQTPADKPTGDDWQSDW